MKNIFEPARVAEVKDRMARLRPESEPLWGSMGAAQAVAHCAAGVEMAVGTIRPPRAMIGRILGPLVKAKVFKDEEPMRRNSPTAKELVVGDARDLDVERERLCGLLDQFVAAGPAGCTKHPHAFFGKLTPEEWSGLMYKHLDHHLRQFGV
jgi:hypothetical protein